jgi:alpha-mannosidase
MKTKKEIYLVPYAHLDTQWRWEFPTTIKKYIKNTIEENLYLFDKYPEHRFNFTGALRYNMMKEYYPEQFKKVQNLVKENRWHLAGTCLDETDALIPSVESMVRNILYGDRWAKKEFGKSSRDYMIPDCFGFPANMPTVLAHCGINGFSSQKLTWNSAVGVPFEIGVWKGPDSSEIICAFNPGAYISRLIRPIHKNSGRLKKLNKLGEKNGIWKSFQYYGVGDIGGAPKEGSVKRAIASLGNNEKIEGLVVRQGSADQFFSEITEEEKERMDDYSGDLLLINHSAGTLTSAAVMKRWNRKNEQLAFATEVAAITALFTSGAPYPKEKIKTAWYRTIGNQMHDILPGTSTPTAYTYSQNDEVVALNTWISILQDSATLIAPFVKGDGSILLFNPLGEDRQDLVEIEITDWEENEDKQAIIIDNEGKSLPVQIQKNITGQYMASFIPKLRSFSWNRYSFKIIEKKIDETLLNPVNVKKEDDCYILENANYQVKISNSGKIESIFHKSLNKELLKKPLAYEFQKEKPAMFPAWNMDWKDRKKEPFHRIENGEKVSITENGPLRSTIQIVSKYNLSTFTKSISLSHDSTIVEFSEKIDWKETGCSLKLALSLNMTLPEVTFNWETSRINRGINNEKLFEMPSRYWADVSEDKWGVSIIEDSKYGYDHPRGDTLRMTLLYTPATRFYTAFWDQKSQDWGEHTIRYAIHGHKGDYKRTDHLARRFNQGIRAFTISDDNSSEAKDIVSLFTVSNDQIGIMAVKKPEDSEGILVRLYERNGQETKGEIIFNSKITGVKQVNGLEEPIGDIPINGNKFTANINANGIRSYIINLENNSKVYTIPQKSLKLDYNSKLIGNVKDNCAIYPADITPTTIQAGPLSYQILVEKELNTLQCREQSISLPNDYNTLSILIGAKQECSAYFRWFDKDNNPLGDVKHLIAPITGFIGQWDTRIWKKEHTHHLKNKRDYLWKDECIGVEPGYVKRDRMEWYSTHTLKNGEVQPYHYGYMYTITLDIPKDAKSLILPDDNRIYIMAITASQQAIKVMATQHLLDKFDF